MLWVFLVLVFFLVFLGLLLLLLLVWGFFLWFVLFGLFLFINSNKIIIRGFFGGSEILFINNNNKIIRFFFVEGGEILFSFVILWLRKRPSYWFSRNCRFHVLLVLVLKGVKQGRAQLYYFSGIWVGTSVLPVLFNGSADIHRQVLAEYWRQKRQRWWLWRSNQELWAEMLFIYWIKLNSSKAALLQQRMSHIYKQQ